jgi:hypothetical protein
VCSKLKWEEAADDIGDGQCQWGGVVGDDARRGRRSLLSIGEREFGRLRSIARWSAVAESSASPGSCH